jgi:hypothetical protein
LKLIDYCKETRVRLQERLDALLSDGALESVSDRAYLADLAVALAQLDMLIADMSETRD